MSQDERECCRCGFSSSQQEYESSRHESEDEQMEKPRCLLVRALALESWPALVSYACHGITAVM